MRLWGTPANTPAVACMMLVWVQPTDRALTGWCPDPGLAMLANDPHFTMADRRRHMVRILTMEE